MTRTRTNEIGTIFDREGQDVTALVEQAAGLISAKEITQMIGVLSGWLRTSQHQSWFTLMQRLDRHWYEDGRRDPMLWFHDTFVKFSDPYTAHVARRIHNELSAHQAEGLIDFFLLFQQIGLGHELDRFVQTLLESTPLKPESDVS